MKVLFSNPPWWTTGDAKPDGSFSLRQGRRAGSRWPFTIAASFPPDNFRFGAYFPYPFFMGYAASYAQKAYPDATVVFRDSITRGESYESYYTYLDRLKPDFIVIESATASWEHDLKLIRRLAEKAPQAKVIVTGPISGVGASESSNPNIVAFVKGEYEEGVKRVLGGDTGVIQNHLLSTEEMNAAPIPMMDPVTALSYWDCNPVGQVAPHLQLWASRGCPYKCLAGDTPVNTVEGMKPIRELVGREDLGVYTYDPQTKKAYVATAKHIRKTGEGERLVRVRFDDGTHIDCTPDHRFLGFKWGNQSVEEREFEVEAQHLKPGMHLRALKSFFSNGYVEISWARSCRMKAHRIVMEWKLGRPLEDGEIVHHIDRDRGNNHPDNLMLCANAKAHFDQHPEVSRRMKVRNPAFKMTPQWAANIKRGVTGLRRSAEAKERYLVAAIKRESCKSPEQKRVDAERMQEGLRKSRPWERRERTATGQFAGELVNHRVTSVEPLEGLHDTYCMEIPVTHWFYANNVLVRNCCFCVWPAVMTGNDPTGQGKRAVRVYSKEYMRDYLSQMTKAYPYKSIYFDDDTFNLVNRHTLEMCEVMREVKLPWSAMCRADTSTKEVWKEMKESGCFGVKVGFESGSQEVIDTIINKRLDLEEGRATVHYLKELGMTVHGTFTVGLPGETPAQKQQTLDFIRSLPLDSFQLSGTAEIEGTPLATMKKGEALKAYPKAIKDDAYVANPDGQMKREEMAL